MDLRLATNAHSQLSKQLNDMAERLLQIPQEERVVRNAFRSHRATVAEIELYEQLQMVMPALARACAIWRGYGMNYLSKNNAVWRSC